MIIWFSQKVVQQRRVGGGDVLAAECKIAYICICGLRGYYEELGYEYG